MCVCVTVRAVGTFLRPSKTGALTWYRGSWLMLSNLKDASCFSESMYADTYKGTVYRTCARMCVWRGVRTLYRGSWLMSAIAKVLPAGISLAAARSRPVRETRGSGCVGVGDCVCVPGGKCLAASRSGLCIIRSRGN